MKANKVTEKILIYNAMCLVAFVAYVIILIFSFHILLLYNSNNMRLMNSIDKEQSSTAYAAEKLINIGTKLLITK